MTDLPQSPVIRLDIDQELFIDGIQSGDEIVDATVATEVTSLRAVADVCVLEGAIVFAGRLVHAAADGSSGKSGDSPSRMEQRLPFSLRVPAKTQPRGIVNVKSRISEWQLTVASDHWLQMEANLQISGLNGRDGFHFQCGSQEFGTLALSPDATAHTAVEDVDNVDDVEPWTAAESEPDADELAIVPAAFEPSDMQDDESNGTPAKLDLADFDRAMDGQRGTPATELPPDGQPAHERPAPDMTARTGIAEPESAIAAFEFEHQVESLDRDTPDSAAMGGVPFSAARSFSHEGFSPHSGFSTQAVQEPAGPMDVSFDTARATGPPEPAEARSGAPEYPGFAAEPLWSFVDFNQPERTYPLRFVVVMDDETLQSVADRLGCAKSELMAANRLYSDEVHAGQTLRVPAPSARLSASR